MKKLLLSLLLGLVAIPASASLYNYYQEQGLPLPSVVDRASLATECGISGYRGTYDQNIKLEECLRNNGDFTPELGAALASSDLTQIVADFRTSLAQKLSINGTTMTLQSVVDDDGVTLASGKYSFTLDGSSSNKEYIICDLNPSTKVCSNIVNISRQGVRTSGAVREHRVGSAVTITDYTSLKYHNDILEGVSSTTGGLLLGNGKISGLYNLDGTFTWIKYNTSTSEIQWSNNGSDYYNFTSSSITQLTASSTAGIGVTDSKIYLKASTTLGGAFDASGNYYQKTSSTQGILNDSNGIYFDYTRDNTWTGTNTFNGTTTGILRIYGDGSDGDLSITSGTTTINLASSTVFEKNYNSISITGDGALAFTGAHSSGTLIILKSLNGVTISTTKKYAIDLTNTGAIGGLKDSGNGQNGTSLISNIYSSNLTAGAGGATAVNAKANAAGGVIGSKTGLYYPTTTNELSNITSFYLLRGLIGGSGGGGGTVFSGGGSGGSSGAGGASGGSLIILNGGQLNWTTSTINASGSAGASAITATDPVSGVKSGSGGGGGGAGGFVSIMSRNITNNYNSILVSGGAGGAGANASKISESDNSAGGAGGAGGSNAFYLGGAGGRGGYESANPSTNGAVGQGVCGGAGGAKGTGDVGIYGSDATAGSGGGGGGGACGFGFSIEY
jgi:hypothetical protein